MEKPNIIDSVTPCSGQYSWRRDIRLNAWLAVTTLVYVAQLFVLRRYPEWSPFVRGIVALTPLVPALLYLRSWVQFIRGMDELQRRVQIEAQVFAAWGTIFIGMILSTLNQHGVVHVQPHGLGFGAVFFVVLPLWLVGVAIANRRYK